MLLAAPLIGMFYENSEVEEAIQVVSIVIVLRAMQNPALHVLRRELRYNKIFWYNIFMFINIRHIGI